MTIDYPTRTVAEFVADQADLLRKRYGFRGRIDPATGRPWVDPPAQRKPFQKPAARKPVVNLTTGERYDSLGEAAAAVGVGPGRIRDAINRPGGTSAGFRWSYLSSPSSPPAVERGEA